MPHVLYVRLAGCPMGALLSADASGEEVGEEETGWVATLVEQLEEINSETESDRDGVR